MVAEHGPTVLRVCRAVLGPADADDAWSETFLSALQGLPGPAGRRQRRGLAGDDRAPQGHRRHPGRGPPAPSRSAEPARAAGSRGRPGAAADDDLAAALAALPAKQRQAVAYHYLAGLPYAEVAAILGGSADAARRAAADGIATLRRTYPTRTSRGQGR